MGAIGIGLDRHTALAAWMVDGGCKDEDVAGGGELSLYVAFNLCR